MHLSGTMTAAALSISRAVAVVPVAAPGRPQGTRRSRALRRGMRACFPRWSECVDPRDTCTNFRARVVSAPSTRPGDGARGEIASEAVDGDVDGQGLRVRLSPERFGD